MSEQIKKSDISEKDVYGWIIESAKMAGVAVGELNKQLQESARISKDTLGKSKSFGNYNEVKQAEIAMKELNKQYQLKIKLEAEALNAERKLMSAQRLYNAEVDKQINSEKKKAQAVQNTQSAYARINVALSNLKKEYRDLAVVQELGGKLDEAQAKRLQTLEGRIKKFDGALKQVDAGMGNYQRNVGNYASATNNLSFSVTQIAREMPAFANSMQTGFMAISNNLPMLFDEITRVNKANKEIQAQGQPTQSMFKSLAGAVLSFQTLLSVGVTLLTVYGKKLIEAFTGAEFAELRQERLNEAIESGNKLVTDYIKSLDKLQNFDKISRDEAIKRVKTLIQELNAKKELYAQNVKEKKQLIENTSWFEKAFTLKAKDIGLAKGEKALNEIKIQQTNEVLKQLYDYLDGLLLANYQEDKSNKLKKDKNDLDKIDLSNKKEAIDLLAIENELLRIRQELVDKQLERDLTEEVKKQVEATRQRGEIETTVIDFILQKERELEEARVQAQYEQEIRNAEFTQQYELAEERRKQALLDIEQRYSDKRSDIVKQLNDAQEQFADQSYNTTKKLTEKEIEERKKAFKTFKEYVDLSLNYFIEKSEQKIAQIDKEIEKAEQQQDYLKELAQQGNITAQQSLAEQQKIIDEANKKKIREQRRIERLKLAESALDIYQTKVENGDKTPLISTIKDITLLKTFINSLPAFYEGIENTGKNGKGLDGKGGFLSVLHPYERVVPADENAKIGDLTNKDLADVAYKYNSGQLVDLGGRDTAGTTYDLYPLLKEMRELKETIENKPQTNIELGEITQSVMNIVQTTQKGNKTTRKAFVIRKR